LRVIEFHYFSEGNICLRSVFFYGNAAFIKAWYCRTKSLQKMIAGLELCASRSVVSAFPAVGNNTVCGSLTCADMLYNDSERTRLR